LIVTVADKFLIAAVIHLREAVYELLKVL